MHTPRPRFNIPGFRGTMMLDPARIPPDGGSGSGAGVVSDHGEPGSKTRQMLGFAFPEYLPLSFGFNIIEVPIAPGLSRPMYGLASWGENEIGQPWLYTGFTATMAAPDVGGDGGFDVSDPVPWGNVKGSGAFLLIGVDIPGFELDRWTDAGSAYVPAGMSPKQTRTYGQTGVQAVPFPAGSWDAVLNAPATKTESDSRLPFVQRITGSRRLQVALLLTDPTAINANVVPNASIVGFVSGTVFAGLINKTTEFRD